ncbi:hypothetical protein BQ8794_50661 [Mesorhizobium prunaredense]|uniref:Uncharacterized protein n=1 Tax=Mesorhizobium prunaredense TaxID=1631249 RepID=A0A1R3VF78_9HYPH|nr:hypothetical protein BQ8794_50661 [Mesorhizobium prunaredense]
MAEWCDLRRNQRDRIDEKTPSAALEITSKSVAGWSAIWDVAYRGYVGCELSFLAAKRHLCGRQTDSLERSAQ